MSKSNTKVQKTPINFVQTTRTRTLHGQTDQSTEQRRRLTE